MTSKQQHMLLRDKSYSYVYTFITMQLATGLCAKPYIDSQCRTYKSRIRIDRQATVSYGYNIIVVELATT